VAYWAPGSAEANDSVTDILVRRCYRFFFQAEDGIRDATVTGVQTCALPISESDAYAPEHLSSPVGDFFWVGVTFAGISYNTEKRSEERRVGKEGRGPTAADP